MTSTNNTERTEMDPAAYLDDPRFHQSFTIPAGPDRPEPFTVTYADFGYRNPENRERERVLLLCGPLFGSRYLHIAKDAIAKRHGVRIIAPDRPGFGGTTGVPSPADRVRAWLLLVPALLEHLGVRRISLAAHSGGAIYALNTLLHLRHLLSDANPYVALCAPWIRPARSGASLMTLAGALPDVLVGKFDKVAGFFGREMAPVTGFSDTVSAVASGFLPAMFKGPPPAIAPGVDVKDVELEERVYPLLIERMYAENMEGLGQEAVLLLKRGGAGEWGEWEDHDRFVTLLAEKEAAAAAEDGDARLRVDVFFSESDNMIGTGNGPKWFDECWREERRGGRIDYASCVLPRTDHDTIMVVRYGVFERILRRVVGEEDAVEGTPTVSAAGQTVVPLTEPVVV